MIRERVGEALSLLEERLKKQSGLFRFFVLYRIDHSGSAVIGYRRRKICYSVKCF
jgi:hypothetical protein